MPYRDISGLGCGLVHDGRMHRRTLTLASRDLARGAVRAIVVANEEFVVWRGGDGRVRTGPRICPHLDHDLADGYVADDELVCAGHAWAFDGDGNAYKRNELGRVDPKGTVPVLVVNERDDMIELSLPDPAP
jgi:phenylpropionate dioxygenase-like ring-hydroxylating dioxygenase large terminal subunit